MKPLALGGLSRWLFPALAVLATVPAVAQNVLFAEHHGKPAVVCRVYRGVLYVRDPDNKELVRASDQRCALVHAEEFYPAFVSVRNLEAHSSYLTLGNSASEINNDFHFKADLTSAYRLHDVFLVLDLDTERAGKAIFFQEIGELGPDHPQSLRLRVPIREAIGEGRFHLHLFAEGAEVFQSELPYAYCEDQLDRMIFKRIQGVAKAEPRPFFGPQPDYPEALRKAGVKGEAVVGFRLSRRGAVIDPVVKSATNPAFGESALACIRLWRFFPRIRNGQPEETDVTMPFVFHPPPPGEKG